MLFHKIKQVLRSIFIKKEHKQTESVGSQICFSLDEKNLAFVTIDIEDPEELTSEEINDNAEKFAKLIHLIMHGNANKQIVDVIKSSSKNLDSSERNNLYFQNVLFYQQLYEQEKKDEIKNQLYDKLVIRPSEAFNRYA